MIKLNGIDHICLMVSNLEESKVYYGKLFGFIFNLYPSHEKMLMVESEHVHFFLKESKMPIEFLISQHLSFDVSNLNLVVEELNKIRITFEMGIFRHFKHRNYKWVEWRDPDGIRLECVEKIE